MNPIQARAFIEQTLNMPTVQVAAQYLSDNARLLDDVFFAVLMQMIQEEQERDQVGSWGSSFEDRLAESLARIGSPQSNQRLQALQLLYQYAASFRQQPDAAAGTRSSAESQRTLQVTCSGCGQTQPITCPGFGVHIASETVAQGPDGPQCTVCGAVFSYVTCACGQVTWLTPSGPKQGSRRQTGAAASPSEDTSDRELDSMIQELTSSGKLDSDTYQRLRSLTRDSAKLDQVLEKLKAAGAHEVGSGAPLNIEDFYREGPGKFELRWPLDSSLPLPVPFSQLDRKTQFYVLFQEWTRRELEGMIALNGGRLDQAEEVFQECLERAQQIEVRELVARSYEGLMRVAQKQGDRALETRWSQKAVEARAG